MVTNGDNGTIGAKGANDDPFETMMIHWSYNGANGDNVWWLRRLKPFITT